MAIVSDKEIVVSQRDGWDARNGWDDKLIIFLKIIWYQSILVIDYIHLVTNNLFLEIEVILIRTKITKYFINVSSLKYVMITFLVHLL